MSRPLNIVWIVSDHQAYGNRPALAQQFSLQSRLTREGIRFSRAYAVLPICSPSRASMLTGLYPHAHGLTENDGRFGGRTGLDPSDWMVHQPLLQKGYRCAWFGKWHLDNNRPASSYGFEGFSLPGYGYPYATQEYLAHLDQAQLPSPLVKIEMPGESNLKAGTQIELTEADSWFDYESGVATLTAPVEVHEAFFLSQLAADWLKTVGEEPFFLRLDPWGPHPPYVLTPPYHNMLAPDEIKLPLNFESDLSQRPAHHRSYRDYWQATLNLDNPGWQQMIARALEHVALVEAALVKILDVIDRMSLSEHTLVIFTADHGDAVGSNGGVSNKGGLMVEETLRIPLLMRGPSIEPGSHCEQLVANIDIAPTIMQLCGYDYSGSIHGRSLVELFTNPTTTWRKGLMAEHYGLHKPIRQRAYYVGHYKLVLQENGFTELYDLQADPFEISNLASVSTHQGILESMQLGLRDAMAETDDHEIKL